MALSMLGQENELVLLHRQIGALERWWDVWTGGK
jgi:hypothetical protein